MPAVLAAKCEGWQAVVVRAYQSETAAPIYRAYGNFRAVKIDAGAVRFDSNVVLPIPTTDTFYVVRVDMAGRGDPVLGDSMPSFTNPVFVTK